MSTVVHIATVLLSGPSAIVRSALRWRRADRHSTPTLPRVPAPSPAVAATWNVPSSINTGAT